VLRVHCGIIIATAVLSIRVIIPMIVPLVVTIIIAKATSWRGSVRRRALTVIYAITVTRNNRKGLVIERGAIQ
jgi:hypothetical protein